MPGIAILLDNTRPGEQQEVGPAAMWPAILGAEVLVTNKLRERSLSRGQRRFATPAASPSG